MCIRDSFWPGPLTMVLPVRDLVPKRTTAGLDTVAVRCPKTAATRELIRLAGVPIAAPSANRSGKPSTTTAAHVLHDMDGRIEAILDVYKRQLLRGETVLHRCTAALPVGADVTGEIDWARRLDLCLLYTSRCV